MNMSERVRTGKIARLPENIRDELNRRLQDGEQGKDLVAWLNSLPKVRAVLKKHFGERAVNKQNLTAWVQSGYRDWQLQQEAVEVVQQMQAEDNELSRASHMGVIDLVSKRLAARYAVATQALSGEDGKLDVKLLHGLCRDVIALRRANLSADRLQIERDRFDLEETQQYNQQEEEFLRKVWRRREDLLIYIKRRTEKRDRLWKRMFPDGEKPGPESDMDELLEESSSTFAEATADTSASTMPTEDESALARPTEDEPTATADMAEKPTDASDESEPS